MLHPASMRPRLVPDHPRQGQDVDRVGTGAPQYRRAGGERGTRRQHVVDQEDPSPFDPPTMSGMEAEGGGGDVLEARLLAEPLLRGGPAMAEEKVRNQAQTVRHGEGSREQRRLVVAAAEQAPAMERDRCDD